LLRSIVCDIAQHSYRNCVKTLAKANSTGQNNQLVKKPAKPWLARGAHAIVSVNRQEILQ
jgi:hypothetical protein